MSIDINKIFSSIAFPAKLKKVKPENDHRKPAVQIALPEVKKPPEIADTGVAEEIQAKDVYIRNPNPVPDLKDEEQDVKDRVIKEYNGLFGLRIKDASAKERKFQPVVPLQKIIEEKLQNEVNSRIASIKAAREQELAQGEKEQPAQNAENVDAPIPEPLKDKNVDKAYNSAYFRYLLAMDSAYVNQKKWEKMTPGLLADSKYVTGKIDLYKGLFKIFNGISEYVYATRAQATMASLSAFNENDNMLKDALGVAVQNGNTKQIELLKEEINILDNVSPQADQYAEDIAQKAAERTKMAIAKKTVTPAEPEETAESSAMQVQPKETDIGLH
jgi:hypothetical protein